MTRIAIDIGGTFTDVVAERGERQWPVKVLTTPGAPERAVLEGVQAVMAAAGARAADVEVIIHGTTLATNSLIERKGARTAFITTEGFRDSIELGTESRFEQYDVNLRKPPPLVAREWRLPVRERVGPDGSVLLPLDELSVLDAIALLRKEEIESVAVGLMHSYANGSHERRVRELLHENLAGVPVSLSSEVSPEMREYERFTTTCANAYVQPVVAGYLERLEKDLKSEGLSCPVYLMISSGGLTTLETGRAFPIRLVESGPAGGALFARDLAERHGAKRVLSFDMGGTTAKVCLIDDFKPQTARVFEVARSYRFRKGSGMPVRIPVIDMVEIGAGGGSIARVDKLGRVAVGPDSAGAEPGPACYGKGKDATVTDADLALGRIDPAHFAGGRVALHPGRASEALRAAGVQVKLSAEEFAYAVAELVDEAMANAARVHAVESGRTLEERTLIAFGGAAPLHVARVAGKTGITRILVPVNAGVGSAVGFLRAPISYEVARSRYARLSRFDPASLNELLATMAAEARSVVERAARGQKLVERRTAFARYVGQGHEIAVPLESRPLTKADAAGVRGAFEKVYMEQYGRLIDGVDVEVLGWTLSVSTQVAPAAPVKELPSSTAKPAGKRQVFDVGSASTVEAGVYHRNHLAPGSTLAGPALIVEDATTTVLAPGYHASIAADGTIVIEHERTR